MVPSWFVHGLSIDNAKSMDKPWRKHGQTMDKPCIKQLPTQHYDHGKFILMPLLLIVG